MHNNSELPLKLNYFRLLIEVRFLNSQCYLLSCRWFNTIYFECDLCVRTSARWWWAVTRPMWCWKTTTCGRRSVCIRRTPPECWVSCRRTRTCLADLGSWTTGQGNVAFRITYPPFESLIPIERIYNYVITMNDNRNKRNNNNNDNNKYNIFYTLNHVWKALNWH